MQTETPDEIKLKIQALEEKLQTLSYEEEILSSYTEEEIFKLADKLHSLLCIYQSGDNGVCTWGRTNSKTYPNNDRERPIYIAKAKRLIIEAREFNLYSDGLFSIIEKIYTEGE